MKNVSIGHLDQPKLPRPVCNQDWFQHLLRLVRDALEVMDLSNYGIIEKKLPAIAEKGPLVAA